jgi:hypothetical protein
MIFQVIFYVIQGQSTLCYYKLFYLKYNNLKWSKTKYNDLR